MDIPTVHLLWEHHLVQVHRQPHPFIQRLSLTLVATWPQWQQRQLLQPRLRQPPRTTMAATAAGLLIRSWGLPTQDSHLFQHPCHPQWDLSPHGEFIWTSIPKLELKLWWLKPHSRTTRTGEKILMLNTPNPSIKFLGKFLPFASFWNVKMKHPKIAKVRHPTPAALFWPFLPIFLRFFPSQKPPRGSPEIKIPTHSLDNFARFFLIVQYCRQSWSLCTQLPTV